MEQEARCFLSEKTPTNPWKETGLFLDSTGTFGCSPDGVKYDNENRVTDVLEIKSSYVAKALNIDQAWTAKKLPYLIKNNQGELTLNENHEYWFQVQLAMYILNLKECTFCVYIGNGENQVLTFQVPKCENFKTCVIDIVTEKLKLNEKFKKRSKTIAIHPDYVEEYMKDINKQSQVNN